MEFDYLTKFNNLCKLRSYSGQNVSCLGLDCIRSNVKILLKGLLQGGQFVTARAREMVAGGYRHFLSVLPPAGP